MTSSENKAIKVVLLVTAVLLVFSGIIKYVQFQEGNKVTAITIERNLYRAKLEANEAAMTDSIEVYRQNLQNLIKLTTASELAQKKEINETIILAKYNNLSDSTANAYFEQKYGASGIIE